MSKRPDQFSVPGDPDKATLLDDLSLLASIMTDPVLQEEFRMRTELRNSRRIHRRRVVLAAASILVIALGGVVIARSGDPARVTTVESNPAKTDEPEKPAKVASTQERAPIDNASLAQGYPVARPSEEIEDGDHRVKVIPEDPFAPLSSLNWYYATPAHLTQREFDASTRTLMLELDFHVSEAAKDRMRAKLARRYIANGRPDVNPDSISVNPLQMVGYRLSLRTTNGELLLQKHEGVINPGKTPVSFEIPAENKALIERLAKAPNFVGLTVTGLYEFGYSVSAKTEAMNLRSSSLKALQSLMGGKTPTGPVIVDRHGKEEYLQKMRNEVRSSTYSAGLEPQAIEGALKQLDGMDSMSWADFLARPGQFYVWNAETRRLEARPHQYENLKNATLDRNKVQTQIKSLTDTISELATHDNEELKFFNHLVESSDFGAKASGGMMGIFSADLSADIHSKKDSLNDQEKKAVKDYMQKARNKAEFESSYLSESEKHFNGRDYGTGTTPKGWDLYLISDDSIVGETLYGSNQVKLLDLKTAEVSENLSLKVEQPRVERSDREVSIADSPTALLPVGASYDYHGRPETIPAGHLPADGSAVSRTEYPELFRVFGTMYGRGDGSTTFNLPDFRGEIGRGADDMGTARGARGVDGGRSVGSTQLDATRQHSHLFALFVDLTHAHRVLDVYRINGDVAAIINSGGDFNLPVSMNALNAAFPYGVIAKPGLKPGELAVGKDKTVPQSKPFEGGHDLGFDVPGGNRMDDRMAITSLAGDPKKAVSGSIGEATGGNFANETRMRNIAVLKVIRAK